MRANSPPTKKLIFIAATALVLAATALFCVTMIRSASIAKLSKWEKDLEGRSIWEVETLLNQREIKLRPGGADSLERETGQILKPNERVLFYVKGSESSWFGPMVIVHGRYLIVDWDQKRLLRVIPFRGVDAL